ncbi:MAG TPA: tyrosine-type recombinase/integrase [Candidatus Eisenbacteria bacterium]
MGAPSPFAVYPALASLLETQREGTRALERTTGQIVPWVFHRGGVEIRDMDDAWRTACKAAGLPGRLFHDLRRSAALALRRLGLSETDIMELAGWETPSMFRRYCVKDETGLAERLQRALNAGDGTATAQTRHKAPEGTSGEAP